MKMVLGGPVRIRTSLLSSTYNPFRYHLLQLPDEDSDVPTYRH